ncbi:MAG TPA: hypothetical protein VMT94_05415 [Burkholderiales bacterium]|nr:hypothetical protein [Burkholderiales bacterium]
MPESVALLRQKNGLPHHNIFIVRRDNRQCIERKYASNISRISPVNREQMIEKLINSSIDSALNDPEREWLRDIFRNGIEGYDQKTNDELAFEMRLRGFFTLDQEDTATDEDNDRYEEERFVMWCGMINLNQEKNPD